MARPCLPAVGVRVPRELTWFQHLFGFSEAAAIAEGGRIGSVRNLEAVRSKFELAEDGTLTSTVNGASYGAGVFSMPSLAELRSAAASAGLRPGTVTVRHEATPDIFEMHTRPELAGATFMAASQFNTLEFPSPDVTPEDGVTGYAFDATQGPACALAAPAATVVRNYLLHIPGGGIGQSAGRQLNLLGELLCRLQGSPGDRGGDPPPLVEVCNGYTKSDEARLRKLNAQLCAATPEAREELSGLLRIGLHSGVEVPWAADRFILRPPEERLRVSQTFCSALACGYSDGSLGSWEPLARLVLEAAYEATLLAAMLEGPGPGAPPDSPPVAVLTFLGGGVFGNADEWIEHAVARAVGRVARSGGALQVVMTHHMRVDEAKAARLDGAIASQKEVEAGDPPSDDEDPRIAGVPTEQ